MWGKEKILSTLMHLVFLAVYTEKSTSVTKSMSAMSYGLTSGTKASER